jgi:hypothetical protein
MSDSRSHRPRFFSTLGVLPVEIAAALWAKGFFQPGYVIEVYQGGDIQMTLEAVASRPGKVPATPSQGRENLREIGMKAQLMQDQLFNIPASPSRTRFESFPNHAMSFPVSEGWRFHPLV